MYRDEIDRIVGLPRIAELTDPLVAAVSSRVLLPKATWESLNKVQCASLMAYDRFNGLLGAIGVGVGKTLISFKIADMAFTKGLRKIMLIVPANCVSKTVAELPDLKQQIAINLPIHVLGGKNAKARKLLSKEPFGLYIMSYSQLSLKDTDELLENIAPELIIADEAHNLGSFTAASTKRIKRYMQANPDTEMCAMSGTLTSKNLSDYAHLSTWCLKSNSPIPNTGSEMDQWGQVLGTTFSEFTPERTLDPVVKWARDNYSEKFESNEIGDIRRAFRYRLETAPGSIASGDAKVDISLMIENVPVEKPEKYEGWELLQKYIMQVNELSMAPNGDEITYSIHKHRYLYQLTSGLYLELYWPEESTVARRRECKTSQAEEWLFRSREHHTAHQMYSSELRKYLEESSIPGLDTPMMVGQEMHLHGDRQVGSELFTKWKYMKAMEFEEIVERDSKAHRVCEYKIQAAVLQAKKLKKSCIFWVYHQEIGIWLYQAMKDAGLNVLYAPSGKAGEKIILDKSNGDAFVIASIMAYGTGQNLQRFRSAYFVQTSRSARVMEQALGRLHRQGYLHDQCVQYTNLTTEFDEMCFASTMSDSLYIHQSLGHQKLVYADYNPLPAKFSAAVLKERGYISNIEEWNEIL